MKKIMKKTMLMLLASLLMMAMLSFSASAAVKNVTVKGFKFSSSVSAVSKAAKKVTRGSMKLKVGSKKTDSGYVKFTAPATKTYTFTLSNLQTVGADPSQDICCGSSYLMMASPNLEDYLTFSKFTTKGGKATILYMNTRFSYSLVKTKTITKGTFLPTRSAKISLKKGQTVYMFFFATSSPFYINLKIS